MSDVEKAERFEQAFEEFNESWLVYWNAYIDLQNQLYESLKAAPGCCLAGRYRC